MASRSTPARKPPQTTPTRIASRTPPRQAPTKAAPPSAAPPPPEPEKAKAPRKRSPPMDRALKFVRLADKNTGRALRLVGNWRGEATDEQKRMNEEIVAKLKEAAPLLECALLDVGLLAKTSFAPTEARGRAITEPFTAGERVAIKEAVYNADLHGKTNDFEVVVQVGGFVKIRPTGGDLRTNIVVNRVHLELLEYDEAEDEAEGAEGESEGGDADADAAEGDEGTDELNFDQQ